MTPDVAAYIVGECKEDEACVAVVPSLRLEAEDFVTILAQNDVEARPLGKGTGRGVDGNGGAWRARGVMVLAIKERDMVRLQLYARLHGLAVARIVTI